MKENCYLRPNEVRELLGGISRPTLWRLYKKKPNFPQPKRLSNSLILWDKGEILAYLETLNKGGENE